MKYQLISVLILIAMTSLAFSQVDTMRLLEVGSVTAPGAITNWYFEDLNGDSIKEIILTTANSVNIYSGSTFAPIWSQSGFTNPKDLNFADINNDGQIDFSVKDTSHIYLIDPHHSTTIWTSPMLDGTFRCYTIGDRNEDGRCDIVFAYQQSIYTGIISIKFYNGPNFSFYDTCIFSVISEYGCEESIKKLYFIPMTYNGVNHRYLYVTSDRTCDYPAPHGHYYYYTGKFYLIDPILIDTLYSYVCGRTTDFYGLSIIDSMYCASLNIINGGIPTRRYVTTHSITSHDTDFVFDNYGDFIGYLIDEINLSNEDLELCFNDDIYNLYLVTFPNLVTLWRTSIYGPNNYLNWSPKFIYTTGIDLNNISYVVCRESNTNSYRFYGGQDGSERWFMPYCERVLNGAVNIHLNQTALLYSVNADTLHLYILAPYVSINNSTITPSAFFLSPNYPNPFNGSTIFEYGLPESGPAKVEIFDILGRRVQTLVDETQTAGYHQVIWNGEDSPSGTYFYRIQAGENSQTKKCLLLK